MAEILKKPEIKRVTRDLQPAHYLFNIESFSLLVDSGVEMYESEAFEVGNHHWRLSLYPNGNQKSNGISFISLYLQIEYTESLSRTWEVNVNFRFFVLDQLRDKYLTIEEGDGVIKRYYQMKKEWGIAQLLSLDHFKDASNGYLVDDCCTFGVDVIAQTGRLEHLSMIRLRYNNTITLIIEDFSKSYFEYYVSDVKTIADSKWRLIVYPRGMQNFTTSLSVLLELGEANRLPPKRKVYAQCEFRVKNQNNSNNNMEITAAKWFTAGTGRWGYEDFMSLWDLRDRSKGYLVNDILIVEAEIIIVSKLKLFL